MPTLIAIRYPHESTALAAHREARTLVGDVVIQPDALAVVTRKADGEFQVSTTNQDVAASTSYGSFWGLLFGTLFFVPLLGMAVGVGIEAQSVRMEKAGVDKAFQRQVREGLLPGTSALFLILEPATADKVLGALGQHGGTVVKSSLSLA